MVVGTMMVEDPGGGLEIGCGGGWGGGAGVK